MAERALETVIYQYKFNTILSIDTEVWIELFFEIMRCLKTSDQPLRSNGLREFLSCSSLQLLCFDHLYISETLYGRLRGFAIKRLSGLSTELIYGPWMY